MRRKGQMLAKVIAAAAPTLVAFLGGDEAESAIVVGHAEVIAMALIGLGGLAIDLLVHRHRHGGVWK